MCFRRTRTPSKCLGSSRRVASAALLFLIVGFDLAFGQYSLIDLHLIQKAHERLPGRADGKIAAVTESAIEGKESIDATGHVVAPGFMDMHFHNAGIPFGQKLALLDGVTTPMEPLSPSGSSSAGFDSVFSVQRRPSAAKSAH